MHTRNRGAVSRRGGGYLDVVFATGLDECLELAFWFGLRCGVIG